MNKPWRPEGWVNILKDIEQSCVISEATSSDIFEAGADAMLKSLKLEADIRGAGVARLAHSAMAKKNGREYKDDGVWVFLPDEE